MYKVSPLALAPLSHGGSAAAQPKAIGSGLANSAAGASGFERGLTIGGRYGQLTVNVSEVSLG
ncbi:hypothetical protein IVB22_34775 [Bradyrhizobium sp. 190]|uniref:hypothetical protein n=1 Tax=Bradyrhizobium sp. 190 TaxID=2782658 RepID=UPI001FF868BE|nr:hypothetical protein [Bradyrhizobium sp. 190]MCK1517559.1 hypothetical protein [Bradyrhizobium sp. 190]